MLGFTLFLFPVTTDLRQLDRMKHPKAQDESPFSLIVLSVSLAAHHFSTELQRQSQQCVKHLVFRLAIHNAPFLHNVFQGTLDYVASLWASSTFS